MTKVLAILRKDARRLWPQILIFNGLLLAGALTDPTYTHVRPSFAISIIWDVALLACWVLIISAIHEEPLVGDRQSWLTQPYTRGGLLAAKALFIVLSVNLPIMLMQAVVLAAVGIPLMQELPALLWRQLFITAFVVMPAAAVAAVTRSLKQIALVALAIAVPLIAAGFLISMRIPLFVQLPAWKRITG